MTHLMIATCSLLLRASFLIPLCAAFSFGQIPTGSLTGFISDESEAAIRGAQIRVTNQETGSQRTAASGDDGIFLVAGLPPGSYEVKAEANGFRTIVQEVTVRTGNSSQVNLQLPIGILEQIVEAIDKIPPLDYDKHGVAGIVSRFQIENLPLNGREFLRLAVLEPGVSAAPSAGFFTRPFDVSILSAPPERTRITMDGAPIYGPATGGAPQNFSQEVIREFQISTVNFDLSTGLTGAGAINVATRYGGNDFHGSGFFFFRDHNMSAYPALRREPTNPDPFFARRQAGFSLGGPIQKNRLFFFTNFEHMNQDGAVTVQPRATDFSTFGGIFPSNLTSNQVTARIDYRLNDKNSLFVRYSHDGNNGLIPQTATGSFPSNWSVNRNWADQSIVSFTTAPRATLVNEFRLSYWYWHTQNVPPGRSDCPGSCPGLGLPQISVLGTDFIVGNYPLVPQGSDSRRYHLADNITWQRGRHQLRFGGEWQYDRGAGFLTLFEPASMVLYSPQIVRAYNADPRVPAQARIPLPTSFRTLEDVLQLPLVGASIGFGDPSQPPSYRFDDARQDHIVRFYWQDRWRVTSRINVSYGLAYHYQTNFANGDLTKPEYLAPILGAGGLAPTRRDANNFAPSIGFVWTPTRDHKTVVRAGGGVFYDLPLSSTRLLERSLLGPQGTGRVVVDASIAPNPIPGIPTVPLGRPLNFQTGPTQFTGANLISILPSLRQTLTRQFGNANNRDLSVRNIEVFKQGSGILAQDFVSPYSIHLNAGVQRELVPDLVLSADFVMRRFVHQDTGAIDLNRWNSATGPTISSCVGQQALDPRAQCSTGPIEVQLSAGTSRYLGLLLRLDRRWSRRYQFVAAYALASSVGLNRIINNDNWFQSYGPTANDRRHTLTLSGIVDLPWGLRISAISTFLSKAPFRAQVAGIDFNGDGTINDLLPGTKWNQLNRGMNEADLKRLVDEYNTKLAGTRTPTGQLIPSITLPSAFTFGDRVFSTDLRVGKLIRFRERYELNVFAEVFNVFNIANLVGHSTDLLQRSSFGQPASRATQSFGSGGPRAIQLAARLSF
ncbi:MAG: TonB-dependent receptor [Bryobacterales bacterium]|nr:TonB-dependent receptor [Bryobacterales bacterium]